MFPRPEIKMAYENDELKCENENPRKTAIEGGGNTYLYNIKSRMSSAERKVF